MPAPKGDAYTRHLPVVLVAVVEVEDPDHDERVAAVARVATTILDVLRRAGGDAESLPPDRIVATFPRIMDSVLAGFGALDRLAEDVTTPGVKVGIGIHPADVVVTGEGRALATAVERASRLAARATSGALSVSPEVARVVEGRLAVRVRDLGPDAEQTHAVLVFPIAMGRRWARRRVVGGIAAALVLAGAAGAILLGPRRRADVPVVRLGVMPFKGLAGDVEHVWLRAAVRDGLNTQLSTLAGVKVYSREFLDFVMTRQGLSEYEAATTLGIGKLLSGSVGIVDTLVRVEAQLVDIVTGTVESSVVVIGREDQLVALQSDLARAVIDRLGLVLTVADVRRLEAYRTNDAEAYRRLLETGEATVAIPPPPALEAPPREPESWLAPRSAWAGELDAARAEVAAFLERYRKTIEARDVDALAMFYVEFPSDQRVALARYFADAPDLRVTLDDVDVNVAGDEAVVTYTRTDVFVDAQSGREMRVMTRPTKLLRRQDAAWRLAPGR